MIAYLYSSSTYLVIFLAVVALIDVTTHRIPNGLTIPAAVAGLALHLWTGGAYGITWSGAGLLTGLALFFPFYLTKGFGAGDVKAMGAVGAFLGPKGVLLAASCTVVAGAVGAILMLLARREHLALRALVARWLWRGYAAYAVGQLCPVTARADDPTRRRFPYGLAIACGTALSLAWSVKA